ncbi:tail fiber assembly protein [Morganella morganii]|uniref:tail fiber assembly protein n=1 Tax=Morganella morganii TaxID=582 RepID=UPI003332D230
MNTEILEQKYFKDKNDAVYCIDIMPVNKDTWENSVKDGWVAISYKEAMKLANPPKTKEQLIVEAEAQKQYLLAEVNTKTQLLQTKLTLGRIRDDEKALLIAWLDYLEELEAVDVSTAPNINWPVKPVV